MNAPKKIWMTENPEAWATRAEFHAWCKEVTDKVNADLDAMIAEREKE